MSKEEVLNKIKMIIETDKYDIEELIGIIPEELIEDVKNIIQNKAKTESEEIEINLSTRTR